MGETPAITRVVETSIYVENLDRSVKFYKDLFEFGTEVHDELICVLHVPGGQALILFPKRIASEPGRTSAPGVSFKGSHPPSRRRRPAHRSRRSRCRAAVMGAQAR